VKISVVTPNGGILEISIRGLAYGKFLKLKTNWVRKEELERWV